MPFQKPHQVADSSKILLQNPAGSFEILPRGFNIVWGNDPRYWKVPQNDSEPASLIQVCWLEVSGSVRVQKGKTYEINFTVSLKADSFGWNNSPVLVMAKVGKRGEYKYQEVPLQTSWTDSTKIPVTEQLRIEVPSTAPDPTLHFGLYEVWSGKWKGGLQIHNATIVPV